MIEVVAAIIQKNSHVLLAKRPLDKHQGGKWEFPGGKVDHGESNEDALIRECEEELGIVLKNHAFYKRVEFEYSDKHVALNFFISNRFEGVPTGKEGQVVQWFPLTEIDDLDFPQANKEVVNQLLRENA